MFTDVMIDLETTGTNSERNAIIQIAAVKFNYETGQVDPDFFDRCLAVHPGREWDIDCRQWWQKQGNILTEIQGRMEDPFTVVRAFYDWSIADWPDRPEGRIFWSKPTSFDHPFLASYFNMFWLTNPYHYRYARDLNSFMAGLSGKTDHPEYADLHLEGSAHNALFDVLHQIKLLLNAKQLTTQGVVLP